MSYSYTNGPGATGQGTSGRETSEHGVNSWTKMQKAAAAVGAVFVVVGILGFIPGITSGFDTMEFAGNRSDAKLVGLFEVSVLHNVVHLLLGVAGLVLARAWSSARGFLIGGGVVYLILWLYGLFVGDTEANFIPVNNADDWLHLILGLGMIGLGLVLSRERTRAA
jgi:hypothetical protein